MDVKAEVVVVGAGPCGLFQVFELGLLGIPCHVVDSLPKVGGQCSTLYPEKPIYDIPALPVVAASELVDRLMEQCSPFAPTFHLGQQVAAMDPTPDDRFQLRCADGTTFAARAVVIAGGLGAFNRRPLRVPGAAKHEGTSLHYRVVDKNRYRGKRVVVLGGGDSALDWTLELSKIASRVTLIHRRAEFRAAPASVREMKQTAASEPDRLRWKIGRIVGLLEDEAERLVGIKMQSFDEEQQESLPLEELLVFYGLAPDLGPIKNWNLEIEKRQLRVNPETFQTNRPGVFAVGDINTYPGKKKLILSGFHEAALAAFAIQKYLDPSAKEQLLYTTTSSLMHERLGVSGEPGGGHA